MPLMSVVLPEPVAPITKIRSMLNLSFLLAGSTFPPIGFSESETIGRRTRSSYFCKRNSKKFHAVSADR
jgi:hypothetical protein